MAVDVIAPDARKKVDELFLYWLSEPSTQDLLRQELARVCGLQQHHRLDSYSTATAGGARFCSSNGGTMTARGIRPSSPTVTPPPAASPSTRSSPKTSSKRLLQDTPKRNGHLEDVDSGIQDDVSTSAQQQQQQQLPSAIEPPKQQQADVCIPPFYFPKGKANLQKDMKSLQKAERIFQKHLHQEVSKKEFHHVIKALGLPFYWKAPLYKACCTSKSKRSVNLTGFKKAWSKITDQCHSEASRFMNILLFNKKRDYLIAEDFETLVQDVVDHHPGLGFLRDAPEFHARYVETVISRIFYTLDRSWKGRLTCSDIQNSNFLATLVKLEKEDDINKVTDFFSYEHFYVIYCKFWELDTDHDLYISPDDLARHCDHALNRCIVDRLFSGVVTRYSEVKGQMSYKDFVWFLLSEEDKSTSRSIEYWFRVLDTDGDGVLSLYELDCFYNDVLERLEEMNIESLSVENTVCQLLDMINPKESGQIKLSDLKKCKLTGPFLNTFINIEKYLEFEQRDSTPVKDDEVDSDNVLTDWERYASEQYELLVAEEQCLEEDEEEMTTEIDEQSSHDAMEGNIKIDYLTVPQIIQ